jgi:hypothetical protein
VLTDKSDVGAVRPCEVPGGGSNEQPLRVRLWMPTGVLTTIDHPLASSDTQAHDLNDRGQIVGL